MQRPRHPPIWGQGLVEAGAVDSISFYSRWGNMVDRKNDLLAMSLLLLAIVLTVWLGMWGPLSWGIEGPITALRIVNYLQKWQTLMAGMMAIGAATIALYGARLAYKASMAKVDLDRKTLQETRERTTLGVALRASYAAQRIMLRASGHADWLELSDEIGKEWKVEMRALFDELDEIWKHLDLFPREVAQKVSDLKHSLRLFESTLPGIEVSQDALLIEMAKSASVHLYQGAAALIHALQGEIDVRLPAIHATPPKAEDSFSEEFKAFLNRTADRSRSSEVSEDPESGGSGGNRPN